MPGWQAESQLQVITINEVEATRKLKDSRIECREEGCGVRCLPHPSSLMGDGIQVWAGPGWVGFRAASGRNKTVENLKKLQISFCKQGR